LALQAFEDDIGTVIEEVVVGCGPCGELRYPSYVEAHGWRFPGVGEFQCYDRRALAQLAAAAVEAGCPEWGHAGPHNAGSYNSCPEDTGFFSTHDGSWSSSYGRFFLDWYSGALVAHGERLLQSARAAFGPWMKPAGNIQTAASEGDVAMAAAKEGPDGMESEDAEDPRDSAMGMETAGCATSSYASPSTRDNSRIGTLEVTMKIAGIHWYYRTHSHAAELTAGYYNTSSQNGYAPLIAMCAKYGASVTLTCVEMCDAQHPSEASCSPEGLLYQIRKTAQQSGVALSGENALPCFSPGGVDTTALERIIHNTSTYDPALKPPPLPWGKFGPSSVSMEPLRGSIASSSSSSSSSDMLTEPSMSTGTDTPCVLPSMRSFTFLRLNQEMIAPAYQGVWMRFMQRMHSAVSSPRIDAANE